MQSLRGLHKQIKKADLVCTQGFIGGHWVEAQSKEQFVVSGKVAFRKKFTPHFYLCFNKSTIDPSTGNEVARLSNMGKVETVDAINAAICAYASWRHTSPYVRIKIHCNYQRNSLTYICIDTINSSKEMV